MTNPNTNRKTGRPSGFEDTLPAEQLLFNQLMRQLSAVVEKYGFSPIDTPAIEWMDTLSGHDDTGGKLIYRVFNGYESPETASDLVEIMDKGLRFDLTVPLARFYGQHAHELPFPFRRYQWGKVFRGESAQTGKGRYREFYQFDADIVGTGRVMADAEVAGMLIDAMRQLELPAMIKINNRRLLDALIDKSGITDESLKAKVLIELDKFDKKGLESVVESVASVANSDTANVVRRYLSITGDNQQKLVLLRELLGDSDAAQDGLQNLEQVLTLLTNAGYADQVSIAPEIVRGLGYYTGIIFETYIAGFEQYGSVASGGRYDNLIAALGGPEQPAVGASFGVSRLLDIVRAQQTQAVAQTPTQVLIVNFMTVLQPLYFTIASQLRQAGIPTQVYSDQKKLGHQLAYASDLGIPWAVIIGEQEQNQGQVMLRDMQTREQIALAQTDLLRILQAKLA